MFMYYLALNSLTFSFMLKSKFFFRRLKVYIFILVFHISFQYDQPIDVSFGIFYHAIV